MPIRSGRGTVYNSITSKEKMNLVNYKNLELEKDFLDYLASTDKSMETIKQYKANLHIFWCWNLEYNNDKFFTELTKREVVRFQNHAIKEWKWSPARIRTVKATLSSLSKYIENILDDEKEFQGFKSIINKVESPVNVPKLEKTVFKDYELKRLLDHLVAKKEYMKACVLSLAMSSGRRKTEITLFKVAYFRPENLICDGALYKTPEKVRTKGRGANGKMLELYTLAAPFNYYLDLWLKERKRLGIHSQWLFPKRRGGIWTDDPIPTSTLDSWATQFTMFLKKPFYWHSLRHYFTTKLVSYDIPSSVIQDVIGWESADMVTTYDDTEKDDRFDKYFGAGGIKNIKPKNLEEL